MGIEILDKLLGTVCGKSKDDHEPLLSEPKKIKGTVVLKKKNLMDTTHIGASFLDRVHEIFGKGVSIQLISSVHVEQTKNGKRGKLGKEAYLEDWITKLTSFNSEDEAEFDVNFEWDEEGFGFPGAFIVKNHHHNEFYLKTLTIDNVPGHGKVHFVCDSWVYPTKRYHYDRVFFTNKTYLLSQTPEALLWYREEELKNLRGENHVGEGMLKEWDRVYDYAYYNDLGMPEKGPDSARPVLGGSQDYPYPRRVKTGRKPNKKDPKTESRLFLLSLDIYVPRDERFTQVKFSDFIGYAAKSIGQVLVPEIRALFDKTINEFDTFEDVMKLYGGDGAAALPDDHHKFEKIRKCIPWELLRELARSDGEKFLKLPVPDVIRGDKTAWRTDEEFGREMLAGVNPVLISLLKEFPPTSKLDPEVYGNQNSTITKAQVEKNMNGLTVEDALEKKILFILDHHDALMPYLRRINTNTSTRTYATRTVLLLQEDGTLKPLAIELSKPHEGGDSRGPVSQVLTPCDHGIESSFWQLAKAYAAVNDSGYHQLISHWLNTHAVIEPFVIAANRQLSVVHPIHKLLKPHFRDTANINALARQILINAGGVLETTVYPGRYAMEMSSSVYKNWDLTEQALPRDLIKRGMAVEDPTKPHGLRLTIEDYPYAADGLEIWHAIQSWVENYVVLYYPEDQTIQEDAELQSWWHELRNQGHGDLKDKPWWPKMETRADLVETLTIVIWVPSALHAAVNFGQYHYAGYLPNRPTVSRRFVPEEGSPEYEELEKNPDLALLKTITAQLQTLLGVSLIEILSRHSADEVYLGQRDDGDWTADRRAVEAFKKFGAALIEIETRILERNGDEGLKNRTGPVNVPYKLLYPNTSDTSKESGLNVWGIPNSISI